MIVLIGDRRDLKAREGRPHLTRLESENGDDRPGARLQSGAGDAAVSLVAQDAVFALADRGATAREIGLALDADLVLAASIRVSPGYGRVRAEIPFENYVYYRELLEKVTLG